VTSPDKTTKSDASDPDLASLDAAWEDDEPEEEDSSDEVDEQWETIPDPKGGPPQRRRVSPKERARQKREKQRLKADAAAQKQKKKKPRSGRARDEADDEDVAPAEAKAKPSAKAPRTAPVKRKAFDAKTFAMIAAALVVAAVALYFMLTSRR
jgi:hypothetical protein